MQKLVVYLVVPLLPSRLAQADLLLVLDHVVKQVCLGLHSLRKFRLEGLGRLRVLGRELRIDLGQHLCRDDLQLRR